MKQSLLQNLRLLIHYDMAGYGILQGSPVEHIARGKVLVIYVTFDLFVREDIIPHVKSWNHANERLLCIKPASIRILLLTQDWDGCPTDGLTSVDKSFHSRLAVHPQLSKPVVRAPGGTQWVPVVGRKRQWQELCAYISGKHPNDIFWTCLEKH